MATLGVPWQEIAARAQKAVHTSIPEEWKIPTDLLPKSQQANVLDVPRTCGILSPMDIEITEQTASELLVKLSTGQLKSVDVTRAFCARAAIAHQLVSFAGMDNGRDY
jgi:amidase